MIEDEVLEDIVGGAVGGVKGKTGRKQKQRKPKDRQRSNKLRDGPIQQFDRPRLPKFGGGRRKIKPGNLDEEDLLHSIRVAISNEPALFSSRIRMVADETDKPFSLEHVPLGKPPPPDPCTKYPDMCADDSKCMTENLFSDVDDVSKDEEVINEKAYRPVAKPVSVLRIRPVPHTAFNDDQLNSSSSAFLDKPNGDSDEMMIDKRLPGSWAKKFPTVRCLCLHDGRMVLPGEECSRNVLLADDPSQHGVILHEDLARLFSPSEKTIGGVDLNNSISINATYGRSSQPSMSSSPLHPGLPFTTALILATAATSAFILLLFVFLWMCRRRDELDDSCWQYWLWRGHGSNLSKSTMLSSQQFTTNPNYYTTSPETLSAMKSLLNFEIPKEKLAFIEEVGEGCFGKVFKGLLDVEDGSKTEVAVKILKEGAGNEAQEDFVREVEIMSAFDHENILKLIGIVLQDQGVSPWMVFEYMAHGDLAELLRANSPLFWTLNPPRCTITKDDLIWLAVQISNGMAYLSSQHFVHRDLATRNCLVGDNLVVKISDFGMSRDIYTCDYYKIGGARMLPVRWMSPESVMYGKFTLESDVWSFGVILWEIYAFGKQPYYGHSNEEVVKLIRQGILLTPPEDCPPYICQLMAACWKTDPYDRMKFEEIYRRVVQHLPPGRVSDFPTGQSETGDQLDSENYLVPRHHSLE